MRVGSPPAGVIHIKWLLELCAAVHPGSACFKECLVPPAGVIPIDRLTDVRAPVEVVTQRVSREHLERVYGFRLPKPDAEDDVPGRWGRQ